MRRTALLSGLARIVRNRAIRTVGLAAMAAGLIAIPSGGVSHASQLVYGADVHVTAYNYTYQGMTGTLEINAGITQTRDNCYGGSNPPTGGAASFWYSVVFDGDTPVAAGCGNVPASAVKATGSGITLSTNTAGLAGFNNWFGSGGAVNITWSAIPGSSPVSANGVTTTLSNANMSGSLLGYNLSGNVVEGAMLVYTGTAGK